MSEDEKSETTHVPWHLHPELLQVLTEIGAHSFTQDDQGVWRLNGDSVRQSLERLFDGDTVRAGSVYDRLEQSYNAYAKLGPPPIGAFVIP
jgi:hypothetical protein